MSNVLLAVGNLERTNKQGKLTLKWQAIKSLSSTNWQVDCKMPQALREYSLCKNYRVMPKSIQNWWGVCR